MKKDSSFIARIATIAGLALGAFALSALATGSTWTAPTVAPPGGNVDAPINVGGGTPGATYAQVKTGFLTLANFIFNPTLTQHSITPGSVLTATDDNGTVGWAPGGDGSGNQATNIKKIYLSTLDGSSFKSSGAVDLTDYCNGPLGCVIEIFERGNSNDYQRFRHDFNYLTYEPGTLSTGDGGRHVSLIGIGDASINGQLLGSVLGVVGTAEHFTRQIGSWNTGISNFGYGVTNNADGYTTNPYTFDFYLNIAYVKTEIWIYPRTGGGTVSASGLYPHVNYQNKNPSSLPLGASDPSMVDPWPYSVLYGGPANSGPMYCTSANANQYCADRGTLFTSMQCRTVPSTSLANFTGPLGAWGSVNGTRKITQVTCGTAYSGDINTTVQ